MILIIFQTTRTGRLSSVFVQAPSHVLWKINVARDEIVYDKCDMITLVAVFFVWCSAVLVSLSHRERHTDQLPEELVRLVLLVDIWAPKSQVIERAERRKKLIVVFCVMVIKLKIISGISPCLLPHWTLCPWSIHLC